MNTTTNTRGVSERTPKDYAIEHAGYLATSVRDLLVMLSEESVAADQHENDPTDETLEELEAAQESVRQARDAVRSCLYEFEKRRDRALSAPEPAAQGEAVSSGKHCQYRHKTLPGVDGERAWLPWQQFSHEMEIRHPATTGEDGPSDVQVRALMSAARNVFSAKRALDDASGSAVIFATRDYELSLYSLGVAVSSAEKALTAPPAQPAVRVPLRTPEIARFQAQFDDGDEE